MQNGAKGNLHCLLQPIWMFWQDAKHLQHSSHQGLPYLSFSVSTFLNCVGLSQQWLASCGVLSQPWPAVGVQKPDQLLKALFAFHTAHCALTQPKRVQTLSVHCNPITVTTMVWMVNQHGNGKTLHKHSGQRRYNIYMSGLEFSVIVKVLIKTFCASVKLCNSFSIWIGDHLTVMVSTYQSHICYYCADKHTAIKQIKQLISEFVCWPAGHFQALVLRLAEVMTCWPMCVAPCQRRLSGTRFQPKSVNHIVNGCSFTAQQPDRLLLSNFIWTRWSQSFWLKKKSPSVSSASIKKKV